MSAKDPSDQIPEPKAASPRQTSKPLPQDYSNLPQKPIKLKPDVSLPPVLKRSAGKSRPTSRGKAAESKPSPKKRTPPSPPSPPPAATTALSQTALETARGAAAQAGVSLETWIENLILDSARPASARPAERDVNEELLRIRQTLEEISSRLDRIEHQKGFWQRFWNQYMEPHRR